MAVDVGKPNNMWLMCGIEWLQLKVTAKNNSLNGMHRTESIGH